MKKMLKPEINPTFFMVLLFPINLLEIFQRIGENTVFGLL